MKRLSLGIEECLLGTDASSEAARKARRAAQIQAAWKDAVEKVYRESAAFVLDHVNGVYLKVENGMRYLVIYADDSLIRSDIDARQEFLKMALADAGERVDLFRIIASRFGMKARKPFSTAEGFGAENEVSRLFDRASRTPLTDDQKQRVDACVAVVDDDRVRAALRNAITAEIEHHGEKR